MNSKSLGIVIVFVLVLLGLMSILGDIPPGWFFGFLVIASAASIFTFFKIPH